MKKIYRIFLVLPLILSGCIEGQIEEVRTQVETLKQVEIASLEKQVKEVSSSITELNKLKEETAEYIAKLEALKAKLEGELSNLNTKLDNIKKDFKTELSASETEIKKQLETVQGALETKIADINTTIGILKEKDSSLEKKISDLKTYADGTFGKKTWVEATFATLASQNALIDDITAVKAQVDALDVSIGNIEKEITDLIDTKIATATLYLNEELAGKIRELTDDYRDYISKCKQALYQAFAATIEQSIQASEEKIKSWVSDKLKDYYTVAQAKAQVEAMYALLGNVPEGKSLQGEINTLIEDLQNAKEVIIKDYEALIKSAIETSEGKMTQEMNEKISTLQNDVIAPLVEAVTSLEGEVQKLTTKLSSLVERVNTLDEQIAAINKSLAVLSDLKMTLKEYVEAMQKSLEDADTQNYNELKGLIEDLQKIVNDDDPSSLQSQYLALNAFVGTIPEGETDLVSWVQKTKEAIEKQFELYATTEYITTIQTQINELLDGQDQTIINLNAKLSTIIEDNKELICSWIDAKLADYWTTTKLNEEIASLKAKLKGIIESEDEKISKDIDALATEISTAETELEEEYSKIISDAITENNGIISKTISDAFEAKATEVSALSGRIDVVDAQIAGLKAEVEELGDKVDAIKTDLGTLQTFINNSGITALQPFIDEILQAISDCSTKYASLTEFNAFKELVDGLKVKVDQLNEIEGKISDAEALSGNLADFLLTGFDEDATLVDILAAINEELGAIWDQIFGKEGETEALQDMINAINSALYGEGGTKDNPTPESLYAQLKSMCDKIVVCKFASVAYVPQNSSRTAQLKQVGDSYQTTLNFEVRPKSLAKLLANSSACKMVYVETISRAATLHTFENVSYSGTDAGLLTVTITVNSLEFIQSVPGISTALFVDLTTEADPYAANFTSSFVKLSY